jgi:hypothetical protein
MDLEVEVVVVEVVEWVCEGDLPEEEGLEDEEEEEEDGLVDMRVEERRLTMLLFPRTRLVWLLVRAEKLSSL